MNLPMTFADVKEIITAGQLHKLIRSDKEQLKYTEFIKLLLESWCTPGDYFLSVKFGLAFTLEKNGKKSVSRQFSEDVKQQRHIALNDFPYFFEEGVLHYILWKLEGEILPTDILEIMKELKVRHEIADYVFFINPPNLKSIPDIYHAHIILKTNSS